MNDLMSDTVFGFVLLSTLIIPLLNMYRMHVNLSVYRNHFEGSFNIVLVGCFSVITSVVMYEVLKDSNYSPEDLIEVFNVYTIIASFVLNQLAYTFFNVSIAKKKYERMLWIEESHDDSYYLLSHAEKQRTDKKIEDLMNI